MGARVICVAHRSLVFFFFFLFVHVSPPLVCVLFGFFRYVFRARMIYSSSEIKRFVIRWRWRRRSIHFIYSHSLAACTLVRTTSFNAHCTSPSFVSTCAWQFIFLLSVWLRSPHAMRMEWCIGASACVWRLALVTCLEYHIENTFMFYRIWISGEWYTRELINEFSQRFAVWLIASKIACIEGIRDAPNVLMVR